MKTTLIAACALAALSTPAVSASWWSWSLLGGCHDDGGHYEDTPAGWAKELERASQYKETIKIVDHGEKVEVVDVVNGKDVEYGHFYRTKAACEVEAQYWADYMRSVREQVGHTPASPEETERQYGLDPH